MCLNRVCYHGHTFKQHVHCLLVSYRTIRSLKYKQKKKKETEEKKKKQKKQPIGKKINTLEKTIYDREFQSVGESRRKQSHFVILRSQRKTGVKNKTARFFRLKNCVRNKKK